MREEYETWFTDKFGCPPMAIDSRQIDFCWQGYQAGAESLSKQLAAMEGQRDRAIDTCAARENEIIKLENKLGEARINFLAIKTSLQLTNDSQEGSITDTLWMIGGTETVFDRLDKALAATEPKP